MQFSPEERQEAHDEFVRKGTDKLTKYKVSPVIFLPLALVLVIVALGYQHHVNAKKQATRCSQFSTQTLAQQYYHDKGKGYYELYANSQGQVCTRLPKG